MEHLVESHLGGYYVSCLDEEDITTYCEMCGDHDRILLSWEEENMIETLIEYFSSINFPRSSIERDKEHGITKKDYIENATFEYKYNTTLIIKALYEEGALTKDEYRMLLKINLNALKKQLSLINKVYYESLNTPVKIRKKYHNK